MQLIMRLEIQSKQNIIDFLNSEPVGRIWLSTSHTNEFCLGTRDRHARTSTSDSENRCSLYASHPDSEKLGNTKRNSKVEFEVEWRICILPSYYVHPSDASQADTLYISVVIKGNAQIVDDNEEKTDALNSLMEKYQKEGYMQSVQKVRVIKIITQVMRGKYKIGRHWTPDTD